MRNRVHVGAIVALLVLAGSASAEQAGASFTEQPVGAERARMLQIIKKVESNPAHKAAAITAGADRSLLCSNCHGKDGNSVQPGVPNLASQNPAYLLQQIDRFATGKRKNFVMNALAASFTMDDKVNLAIYYSSMKLKEEKFDPILAERGKQIFNSICYLCHGVDGMGGTDKGFARIAGQRPSYVEMNLKRFRAVARHDVESDDIVRDSPRMEQVTQNLSDDDITALANYVASLNK